MIGCIIKKKGNLGGVASEQQLLDEPDEIFGVECAVLDHCKSQSIIGADGSAYGGVLGLLEGC